MIQSPGEILNHFCSSRKPRHSWNLPIRAIVPKPPAGIPIDRASTVNRDVYKLYRQLIGSILFRDESFGPLEIHTSNQRKEDRLASIKTLDSPEENRFIEDLRQTRLSGNLTTVLVAFDGSHEMTLGMIQTGDYEPSRSGIAESDRWSIGKPNPRKKDNNAIAGVVWRHRAFKDEAGKMVWPIHPAGILEAGLLPYHFTMLIPPAVQREFFGSDMPNSGFFIKPDGTYDLGQAIEHRRKIWNAFFEKSVSVDEAQTDDPSTIQFNLKLNLEVFCAYARPVKDLLTR